MLSFHGNLPLCFHTIVLHKSVQYRISICEVQFCFISIILHCILKHYFIDRSHVSYGRTSSIAWWNVWASVSGKIIQCSNIDYSRNYSRFIYFNIFNDTVSNACRVNWDWKMITRRTWLIVRDCRNSPGETRKAAKILVIVAGDSIKIRKGTPAYKCRTLSLLEPAQYPQMLSTVT